MLGLDVLPALRDLKGVAEKGHLAAAGVLNLLAAGHVQLSVALRHGYEQVQRPDPHLREGRKHSDHEHSGYQGGDSRLAQEVVRTAYNAARAGFALMRPYGAQAAPVQPRDVVRAGFLRIQALRLGQQGLALGLQRVRNQHGEERVLAALQQLFTLFHCQIPPFSARPSPCGGRV